MGFQFLLSAGVLELAQLGGVLCHTAGQPRFLKLQVAKLLFVGEEGFELDQAGTESLVVILELVGKLHVASCIDGHFEPGDPAETPGGIGNGLDQIALARPDGREFLFISGDVALVVGGIIGVEQDGAAGEPCFDRIEAGSGFTV